MTKGHDLTESLTIGIDRAQRYFSPLAKQIGTWKETKISESVAKEIIYNAFTGDYLKAPIKLLKHFHEFYFEDDRFEKDTFWRLSNAGTSAFKELKPTQQYECTARWGKLLNTSFNNLS